MSTRGSMRSWRALAGLALFGALPFACSDDTVVQPDMRRDARVEGIVGENPPPPCSLKITAVNGRQVASVSKLTDGDDQDGAKPGIQIDVEVAATNPPVGGQLRLNVSGLTPDPSVGAAPTATFKGVTIGVDLKSVVIKAYATGCSQDTVSFPVVPPPECVFLQPPDGASLAKKDDKNQATAEFEYDVKVYTKNAEGGQVTLIVGASTLPGAKTPDATGSVTFSDAILPEGVGTVLKAEVAVGSVKRSCEAKINVATGAPKCVFLGFNPAPITTSKGKPGLGIAQDAAPATPGIQTNVEVQTENIAIQVSLLVNGAVVKTVTASGGVAKLDAVTIADGEREVQASCSSPSGVATKTTPSTVTVDGAAPSAVNDLTCTIANNREGKLSCSWTAVGDGTAGSGMEAYDLRYSIDAPLTAASWASATKAKTVVPSPQGLTQTVDLTGMPLGHTYYLGLKASDVVKNETDVAIPTGAGNALLVDFKAQERALSTATAWGSIVAAGDFDCDGYTDLAVGDPGAESNKGKVYIYLGSKNGLSVNPVKLLNGTVAGGRFGARLAMLHNFDGDTDSCNDLAVTASHGDTKDAKVYLYFGRKLFFDRDDVTTGLGAEAVYQLGAAATAGERLGGALASAGDFDGDGLTDLALSWLDTGAADAASVFVVYGDKTIPPMGTGKTPLVKLLPASAGVRVNGGKASDNFGISLGAGAQLDADIYSELLIGAKDTQVSGAKRGAVHLVKGAARASTLPETIALGTARVITISGGASNGAFGTALGLVGDMDKDGNREFAVTDPTVASGAGAIYLFNLKTTPATAADAVSVVGNDLPSAAGNAFGQSLADAASFDPKAGVDFQNDGLADLCAGAKAKGTSAVGAVFQIGAASLTGLAVSKAGYTWNGPAAAPSFGLVLMLAKDLNGDGYVDLVIGDPSANGGKGRFYAYY